MKGEKLPRFISQLKNNSKGATAIEYGLIVALIAVVILSAVTIVGTGVSNTFNATANTLSN